MGVGADGDHAGRGVQLEPVKEQVGQQERRQMVERNGAFQAVCGGAAGTPVATGVVDQHVGPRQGLEHLAGQPPHLRLGGQVREEYLEKFLPPAPPISRAAFLRCALGPGR